MLLTLRTTDDFGVMHFKKIDTVEIDALFIISKMEVL